MPSWQVAMNELSNHDHSRFLTRTNHKVGRTNTLGPQAAEQGINKAVFREGVVIQMTWTGAPTIYYGDEAGVCGFTDPDNRRTDVYKRQGNTPLNLTKRKKQWLYNREDRKGNSHGDRETGTEKSGTEVMCTGIHAVPAEAVGVCGEF